MSSEPSEERRFSAKYGVRFGLNPTKMAVLSLTPTNTSRFSNNGEWYFRGHESRALALQEAAIIRADLENDGWSLQTPFRRRATRQVLKNGGSDAGVAGCTCEPRSGRGRPDTSRTDGRLRPRRPCTPVRAAARRPLSEYSCGRVEKFQIVTPRASISRPGRAPS
jgi:hypothetical protein